MSALPPKADIGRHLFDVRFVPIADIATSGAPRGKLSKVVNFEQKILHPLVSVGSSYTPCGRSRCARTDPHIVHEDLRNLMSRCVLVVEDEALVNMFITSELRAAGHEVLTAFDADEAIRILEERNDIDLVFTDIQMPGSMDGLKLAAAVKLRWPPIRILVTTGKAVPTPEQMPAGSAVIPKPYKIQDVLKAVHGSG
jgi:two-component system, response regulator PdtaR